MTDARLRQALRTLGGFVATLTWSDVPEDVRERLRLVLLDHVGVTLAGAATPEQRRLVAAEDLSDGAAPLLGSGRRTAPAQAAWLNATAACSLELDEGSKHARGHPAVHAFPAALALGAVRHVPGDSLLVALLVGYEVAARFGAATRLHAGVHPHGNWGVAGAAAAAARLHGLQADAVAGALDAAGGLGLAAPFSAALRGTFVRNTWAGAANRAGLDAARLAVAGLTGIDGTAADALGAILGELDCEVLDIDLGSRWYVQEGYFKRHASCAYTHPPADAALRLRERLPNLGAADVTAVTVETHAVAATLDGAGAPNRLAAMFSVPYVVAVALLHGDCLPERFDDRHRADPGVTALAERTTVAGRAEFDRRLPHERAARVTLTLRDGSHVTEEVPNAEGDADHHPFGQSEVAAKLQRLLEPSGHRPADLAQIIGALDAADDVTPLLWRLP